MTEITVSEILNRAADLIQERGWSGGGTYVKGGWYPVQGESTPVCAEGAIRLANSGRRANAAIETLQDYLGDRYPECFNSVSGHVIVFSWNDRPGRTALEVIEALRACAVIEASRERQPALVFA